jgi:hypothetical protein
MGLSPCDTAKSLGLSKATLYLITTGKRKPKPYHIQLIRTFLKFLPSVDENVHKVPTRGKSEYLAQKFNAWLG